MRIRELDADDTETYWTLRLRGLREHPDAFGSAYEEVVDRPIETTRQLLRQCAAAPESALLGAFDEHGHLLGMARLDREKGLKSRHKALLTHMYVAPQARGQGVGRALVEEIIERAQQLGGVEQIVLAVTAQNISARALYAAIGFVSYGCEPHALRLVDGTYRDEELMILWLKAQ